jgi:hypothetical protein
VSAARARSWLICGGLVGAAGHRGDDDRGIEALAEQLDAGVDRVGVHLRAGAQWISSTCSKRLVFSRKLTLLPAQRARWSFLRCEMSRRSAMPAECTPLARGSMQGTRVETPHNHGSKRPGRGAGRGFADDRGAAKRPARGGGDPQHREVSLWAGSLVCVRQVGMQRHNRGGSVAVSGQAALRQGSRRPWTRALMRSPRKSEKAMPAAARALRKPELGPMSGLALMSMTCMRPSGPRRRSKRQ